MSSLVTLTFLVLLGNQQPDAFAPRIDLIPEQYRGADGKYKPLRTKLVIPDVARDKVICFCLYTTHRGC